MWGSPQFLQGSPKTAASSCGLHPNFYRGPWGPPVNSGVGFPPTFTGVPGDPLSAAEGSPPIFAGVPGDPCQQWWGSLQFLQAAPRDPLRAEVEFTPISYRSPWGALQAKVGPGEGPRPGKPRRPQESPGGKPRKAPGKPRKAQEGPRKARIA